MILKMVIYNENNNDFDNVLFPNDRCNINSYFLGENGNKMERDGTNQKICPNNLAGIYREIAEIVGVEATIMIHTSLCGQQIAFPKKLYSITYIKEQIVLEYDGTNIRKLASKYGYTERHLRKILKEITTEEK